MSDARQPDLFSQDVPPWEIDASMECRAASIVFAEPPYGPFHYRIPERLVETIAAGMRVKVPLGKSNRLVLGYCISIETIQSVPSLLKEIHEPVDHEPLCTGNLLKLIQWMSRYYLVPMGQVFEAVVPAGVRGGAGLRTRVMLTPAEHASNEETLASLPIKQRQVLQQLLLAAGSLTTDQLQAMAKCSTGPIQSLRERGLILAHSEQVMDQGPQLAAMEMRVAPPALSADQRHALNAIGASLDSGRHETLLLHGVTGSGKTEVYMQAIERTVAMGRQAIVLVPEISLTPQTRSRFQGRFGRVALLHSHMSDVERHQQWRRIASGQVPVVIGPRSAIFAPLPQLGLIILDEEHETTFKQETIPRYHARDVALQRAVTERIPLILGSATPSLETWHRATNGKYRLISMPRRIQNRPLPTVNVIDLRDPRNAPNKGAISAPLHDAIQETLRQDGQCMLLLNRRGFATSIQCPHCGHVVHCPDCDLPLTHHHDGSKAVCHYCDHTIPTPPMCPKCQFADIRYAGMGTQKLEMEVQRRFPSARIGRMDSDTMRKPGSHERILSEFREGHLQILLGTQMIAKGLDFPNVLLVGIINADTALHFPDFRAAERTFHLVTQVAGRTGRGQRGGEVWLQTFSPDHPAIACASRHDYQAFAEQELGNRVKLGYPPFGSMARMIIRGPNPDLTDAYAKTLARNLNQLRVNLAEEARVLGPAPTPISKLRGLYRFHIMLFANEAATLNRLLGRLLIDLKPPEEIQFVIDIDPVDMQ